MGHPPNLSSRVLHHLSPALPSTSAFRRQIQEVLCFLLLISVRAENPFSQSQQEDANGRIILTISELSFYY